MDLKRSSVANAVDKIRSAPRLFERKKKKRSRWPRFCYFDLNLAPVSFNHDPAAALVLPVAPDPALVLLGWMIPTAWIPYIMVVVVAMITVDPDGSPVRARSAALVNIMRRPDANGYLRQ